MLELFLNHPKLMSCLIYKDLMDALFSMIDGCFTDEIDTSECKEADDILTDFCSAFNYSDLNQHEVERVLPVKGYGNHGFGKILRIPKNYLNDEDEDEDEVKHLPAEATSIQHGGRSVSKKTTEADEVETEVNKALMEAFGEDDHKEVEGDDDKYCTAVTKKSITQLSKEELEAKLERSKAKLRTIPTRHSKVLEIDQIPNLKRSGQSMKKVASVPKRKLQQEARDYRSAAKETMYVLDTSRLRSKTY
ncbi:hypothetical protein V2J09_009429 [Rumex salicifolius]